MGFLVGKQIPGPISQGKSRQAKGAGNFSKTLICRYPAYEASIRL